MRLYWKTLQWAGIPAFLLLGAGCGGLNASGGASPASILLPGMIKADPPPTHPGQVLPAEEPGKEVARF